MLGLSKGSCPCCGEAITTTLNSEHLKHLQTEAGKVSFWKKFKKTNAIWDAALTAYIGKNPLAKEKFEPTHWRNSDEYTVALPKAQAIIPSSTGFNALANLEDPFDMSICWLHCCLSITNKLFSASILEIAASQELDYGTGTVIFNVHLLACTTHLILCGPLKRLNVCVGKGESTRGRGGLYLEFYRKVGGF